MKVPIIGARPASRDAIPISDIPAIVGSFTAELLNRIASMELRLAALERGIPARPVTPGWEES